MGSQAAVPGERAVGKRESSTAQHVNVALPYLLHLHSFCGCLILEPRSFDGTRGVGWWWGVGSHEGKVAQCGSESKGRGFEHVIVG